jgi:hypothetical protein
MMRETIAAGLILLLGGAGYAGEGTSPVAECVNKSGEAYVSARGDLLNTPSVNSLHLAGKMPSWWVDSIVWRSQHPQEAKQFDDIVAKHQSWFDKVYKDKDGLDPEWLSQKEPEFLTTRSPAEAAVWQTTTQGFPASLWLEWAIKIRPDWPVALRRELIYSVGVFCDPVMTSYTGTQDGIVDAEKILRGNYADGAVDLVYREAREKASPKVFTPEKANVGFEKPPYAVDTPVLEYRTNAAERYVRVYNKDGGGQMAGRWMMKESEIQGLTPAQIREKFALPTEPSHVCSVDIPGDGRTLRKGKAGPVDGWGAGGGTQNQIVGDLVPAWFSTERRL